MNKKTLISVFVPAYNCERYIGKLIDSFLTQSYDNFELIIVDDCSSDNTCKIIENYKDSGVKLIRHEWNKGVNSALNTAFENSRGQYIVFTAGDDMVTPTYLEKIVSEFERQKDCGVIYTSLIFIDELDNIVKPQPKWAIQRKENRANLLNEMFYKGNALLSPGMVMKRELIDNFMPLDTSLSVYQDYFLHVNLLIRSEIGFSSELEYYYRRHSSSLSVRKDSYFREDMETPKLMNAFLQIKDIDFLKRILQNDSIDIKHKELIPYYLGISALRSQKIERQKWGYRTILDFIDTNEKYEKLNKLTGFSYKDLLNISSYLFQQQKKDIRKKRIRKCVVIIGGILFLLLVLWIFIFGNEL